MALHLVPRPQHLALLEGAFPLITSHDLDAIASAIQDWAPGAAERLSAYAAELAETESDVEYVDDLSAGHEADGSDEEESLPDFSMTAALKEKLAPESFNLAVSPEELVLEASDANGALYAVNALIQALRSPDPQPFEARSTPKYGVRGVHLDISRHFFGPTDIKRVIDLASAYNLNRLHLHLTDDQGWRIEIPERPELTALASGTDVSGGTGGFLTLEEYEDIQNYAEHWGMDVVPEIDLPGHSHALLLAYPEASNDGEPREPYTGIEVGFSWVDPEKDATWEILEDVVASLAKHTHSEYLHIGGDEVFKIERPEFEKFMERLALIVAKHGKKVVAWNDTAGSTLPAGSQLQFWNGEFSKDTLHAALDGTDTTVIASPAKFSYLDLKPTQDFPLGLDWAGLVDTRTAFDWEPAEAIGVPADRITGVEACLWTETVATFDHIATMYLPRLTGVASVAWGSPRILDEYLAALPTHGRAWEQSGYAFYKDPAVNWD